MRGLVLQMYEMWLNMDSPKPTPHAPIPEIEKTRRGGGEKKKVLNGNPAVMQ